MTTEPDTALAGRHRSLTDLAYETLRRRILDHKYERGERLAESVLADELGVSRLPVREALRRLAEEGFVDITPRRSPVVSMPSFEDFLEVYDVRVALEALSVRLAAQNRTDEDLQQMAAILTEGEEALAAARWNELAELNSAFHSAIARSGRNSHLIEVVTHYRARLSWMHTAAADRRGSSAADEWHEHREIFDAIAAQDLNRVVALADQHARGAREDYLRCLA